VDDAKKQFAEGFDSAEIHSVLVFGLEKGGASKCFPCGDGMYSGEAQSRYSLCPPGTQSTVSKETCESCTENTYSDMPGLRDGCLDCPSNTYANHNNTFCLGSEFLNFTRTFD
jgi:hypothetical protein